MTTFQLLKLIDVSNPRPLYKFLELNDYYDRSTKILKITQKEFQSEYKKYIKQRIKNSYLTGKRGRPKNNT